MRYPFDAPIPPISSPYGPRLDPISGASSFHYGTDFAAALGTPVYAVAAGTVVESRLSTATNRSYGEYIKIDHGGGIQSLYAHLDTGSRLVAVGDVVTEGQRIGDVGNTGYSTGPHLHFEIWQNGTRIDPIAYLDSNSTITYDTFEPNPSGKYYVVGDNGRIGQSSDGLTWSFGNTGIQGKLSEVTSHKGIYNLIAHQVTVEPGVVRNGLVYRSNNAVTWISAPGTLFGLGNNQLTVGKGQYVVSTDSLGRINTSIDGFTTFSNTTNVYGTSGFGSNSDVACQMGYGDGIFIAIKGNSNSPWTGDIEIIRSNDPKTGWEMNPDQPTRLDTTQVSGLPSIGGVWNITGYPTGVSTSALPGNPNIYIAYGEGVWVIAANVRQSSTNSTPIGAYIFTSTDAGQTWSGQQYKDWKKINGLRYLGGSDFVVWGSRVPDPLFPSIWEHVISRSTDGLDWTTGIDYPSPFSGTALADEIIDLNNRNGVWLASARNGQLASLTGGISTTVEWDLIETGWGTDNIYAIYTSFADIDDPYIDGIALADEGHTARALANMTATLTYEPPADSANNALPLYRVSKDYRYAKSGELIPAAPRGEDGRPYYDNVYPVGGSSSNTISTEPGILPYHKEIVEEWGKIAIFIDNTDVTFYRDTATVIENITWQTTGNFETLRLHFGAITVFDKQAITRPTTTSATAGGVLSSAIPWLAENKPVAIKRIRPNGTQVNIWLGSINGIEISQNGLGASITANGLLYDIGYQLLPPIVEASKVQVSQDVGITAANTLNSLETRLAYATPKTIGIKTIKAPDWSNPLDYLRSLQGIGAPEVWVDTQGRPDVAGRTASELIDLISGQEGLDMNLTYDTNAPVTVIYGKGKYPNGVEWYNTIWKHPLPGTYWADAPGIYAGEEDFFKWPFDDINSTIKVGDYRENLPPLRPVQTRYADPNRTIYEGPDYNTPNMIAEIMVRKGYLSNTDFFQYLSIGQYYNEVLEASVKTMQNDKGLEPTGVIDYITWSAMIDVSDLTEGATIAPLYTSPLVNPSDPSYDPAVRRVEQYIDFGDNIDVEEAKQIAKKIIERDMIRYNTTTPAIYKQRKSVTGNLTLTVCPATMARWDIKPGDRIRLWTHIFSPIPSNTHTQPTNTTFDGGNNAGSLLLYVKRVEWHLGDTPAVTLSVSSRDLEYSELEAAQHRIKVSKAEKALNSTVKRASGSSKNIS